MSEQFETRLEELLLQYTYFYGMRRSRGDKEKCYAYIQQKYEEMGYPVTYGKLSAGVTRMGYCQVGDLAKAETIFIAPFDTQQKTFFPFFRFFPLEEKRSQAWFTLALIWDGLLEILLVLAGFSAVYFLSKQLWAGLLTVVVIVLLYSFATKGIFNFSASAPLALMHYVAVHSQKRKKYAFVFLDRSSGDYLPLKFFLVQHKSELDAAQVAKTRRVLHLSNLAHSEELILAGDDFTPGDLAFAKACGAVTVKTEGAARPLCLDNSSHLKFLTAVDQDKAGRYYVKDIRCKRDKTMDVKRLKTIAQAFLNSES